MNQVLPLKHEYVNTVQPNYTRAMAIRDNDVMAFYNEAMQDDRVSIVLDEAKTNKYPDLSLAYK